MYFGSVRFFRHLIIAVLLLILLLPLIGAGVLSVKYAAARSQLEDAVAVIDGYSEKQDELKAEFDKLSSNVRSQIALLQPQINVAINSQMSDFREQLDGIISEQEQTQRDLDALIKEHSGGSSDRSIK